MSGDLQELARSGRLASVLCGLAAHRFSGLVYVEHAARSLVISMRAGRAVYVEDPDEQTSVPDALLEQGLINKEQYADIATRVIESLADNEDFTFCRLAVELGATRREAVDTEVERRVRGRLIQAVAWDRCLIEIDEDSEAVSAFECPQELGPIIYMGVRTFFDDDRVRAVIGTEGDVYGRLVRTPEEIAQFFQLEPEESALVAEFSSGAAVEVVVESHASDALEGFQLVCMLSLADMIELSATPFASAAERSGVRNTQALERGRLPSQARMPVVREEQVFGSPRPRALLPREEGGGRAVREEHVRPASRPHMPAARDPFAERAPARSPAEAREASGARREDAARAGGEPRTPETSIRGGDDRRRGAVANPTPSSSAGSFSQPQREAAPAGHPGVQPRPPSAARTEAVAAPDTGDGSAPSPMPRKRPVRRLSAALQRLDRELKGARPQPSGGVEPPGAAAAPPSRNYARACVEQLVRMRHATLVKQQGGGVRPDSSQTPEELFRQAQEAMRDQQFGRAHDSLRKACDADPNNEMYAMFCMWAAFRAGALKDEEGIGKLRIALRNKVSDDQHKAFAYYALGHVALAEKKDDSAEKFFRKAVEFDKHNKDAERHLRVIELRRKTAATPKNNKIFGIEIGKKSS
jgi:hypothetical protein